MRIGLIKGGGAGLLLMMLYHLRCFTKKLGLKMKHEGVIAGLACVLLQSQNTATSVKQKILPCILPPLLSYEETRKQPCRKPNQFKSLESKSPRCSDMGSDPADAVRTPFGMGRRDEGPERAAG